MSKKTLGAFAVRIGAYARRLRKGRKEDKTQLHFAPLVPMQPAHLGYIERGQKNARLETLWRLEAALGLARYELFNENSEQEGAPPCYATLNSFIRCNVRLEDDAPDTAPSPLLNMIGDSLLEIITLKDIERDAGRYNRENDAVRVTNRTEE